jgi:hypothetical protein
MRSPILTVVGLLALAAARAHAADLLAGRWEGRIDIPGRELPLIVDLAPGAGGWTGSLVIPGLGIKGAPVTDLVVTESGVSFALGNLLASPTQGPAVFKATLQSADRMAGEMRQAGNVASVALARQGAAQVEVPPGSTAVAPDLATQWSGEFELDGYPRQVTVTLENRDAAGAQAKLVIVGKRTTEIPIDLVIQQGTLLRLESSAMQIVFEGRVKDDTREIAGTMELGPLEMPLVLRRRGGGS